MLKTNCIKCQLSKSHQFPESCSQHTWIFWHQDASPHWNGCLLLRVPSVWHTLQQQFLVSKDLESREGTQRSGSPAALPSACPFHSSWASILTSTQISLPPFVYQCLPRWHELSAPPSRKPFLTSAEIHSPFISSFHTVWSYYGNYTTFILMVYLIQFLLLTCMPSL